MKVRVHIKYPYWQSHESDEVIDIPEGQDPEDYIYENREEILVKYGCELEPDDLYSALDMEYADVVLLEEFSFPGKVQNETGTDPASRD